MIISTFGGLKCIFKNSFKIIYLFANFMHEYNVSPNVSPLTLISYLPSPPPPFYLLLLLSLLPLPRLPLLTHWAQLLLPAGIVMMVLIGLIMWRYAYAVSSWEWEPCVQKTALVPILLPLPSSCPFFHLGPGPRVGMFPEHAIVTSVLGGPFKYSTHLGVSILTTVY